MSLTQVGPRDSLWPAAVVAACALIVLALASPAMAGARAGGASTGTWHAGEREWPARALARDSPSSSAETVGYSVGPITDVSSGCPETGDVEEATDPVRGYVYVAFEGCDHDNGIGFVRSTSAGMSYSQPLTLPGSRGGWDPSVAVAPDGTLYVAFMNTAARREYPIIDVSHDQGRHSQSRTHCFRSRPATGATPST